MGKVPQDFGQPHHGHLFRAHNALQAGFFHARAAHAEDLCGLAARRQLRAQCRDDQRSVMLTAGFAR